MRSHFAPRGRDWQTLSTPLCGINAWQFTLSERLFRRLRERDPDRIEIDRSPVSAFTGLEAAQIAPVLLSSPFTSMGEVTELIVSRDCIALPLMASSGEVA